MPFPDPQRGFSDSRSNPDGTLPRSADRAGHLTPEVDDVSLLGLIQGGDEGAMATLYDRYGRLVYSVALRVLRDPATAEDVLQDTFMQVWRKPESFLPGRGSMAGWLAVSARNRAIDFLRRRKPSDPVEEVVLAAPYDVAKESERRVLTERARGVMVALPAEQRQVIEMAFFDGLTHTEIAELTGEPLGTVKTRIRTGLMVLRRAMQP